jgi:hypothetical protein
MVIRTEYRGTSYSMGSSDPLPAGFEIRFGDLNFQATGNGYLMRLTNREEIRARRQVGSAPVAAARVAATPAPASTDAAGPSASRRRRRSGQRSRQARSERRHAEIVTSQRSAPISTTTAAPAGERSVSGPRFPIGLRGATASELTSITPPGTWRPRLLSRLTCSRPTTGTPVQSNIVPRAHHCWTYGPSRNQDKIPCLLLLSTDH